MSKDEWDTIIKPKSSLFSVGLKEIWKYRDLLILFVKRDIAVVYKQTILGPLWYILQPLVTTMMFTFVFGELAQISTDGVPHLPFYLLGVTMWGYFSACLSKTSNTFVSNQGIFGKVYFPRFIVPASLVISNLGKFFIQMLMFAGLWGYYVFKGGIVPNYSHISAFPFIIITIAVISLGFGMLFSAMTTKYRDLQFMLSFGIQLWMYATPVIYPLSSIPEVYQKFISFNPVAPLLEAMRFAFLGKGSFEPFELAYSFFFGVGIFLLGLFTFTRVEKSFMDTV